MYPDRPPGYDETWVLQMKIYPPVDVGVIAGALGANGVYPMYPGAREVRVNDERQIEVWERRVSPPRPGTIAVAPPSSGQAYGGPDGR